MERAAFQQQRKKRDWSRPPAQENSLITNLHPLTLTAKQPHLPPCPNLPSKIHILFPQFNTHEPLQRGQSLSCAISEILRFFSSLVHPWGRERQHLKGLKELRPDQISQLQVHASFSKSIKLSDCLLYVCFLCSCLCIQGKPGISAFTSYD